MASILKVDTIQDQSGNNIINESADTITIGASGDTITVPTGATLTVPSGGLSGQNYPAFEATLTSVQSISDNTFTKVQFDSELFDTDSAYDNATNYRFTVPSGKAGKYYFYSMVNGYGDASNQDILDFQLSFYVNGSINNYYYMTPEAVTPAWRFMGITLTKVLNLSDGDYVEVYASIDSDSGTANIFGLGGSAVRTIFGGYRIGA